MNSINLNNFTALMSMFNNVDQKKCINFKGAMFDPSFLATDEETAENAATDNVAADNATADNVDLSSQAASMASGAAANNATAATTNQPDTIENFSATFTPETVADLFGLDASQLSDTQKGSLTNLLFDLNNTNQERIANGEQPMTKEELNAYLSEELAKYNAGEESEIGKALSELGIKEIDDATFEKITKALDDYNAKNINNAEDKAAQQAKPDESKQAPNQTETATGANGSGSASGPSSTGSASGAHGTSSTGSSKNATPRLPDDLNELQGMKAKSESELGDLKNKLDDKQSEINTRKKEITDEALANDQDAANKQLQADYDKAKQEFDTASNAKEAAQNELTKAEQDSADNEKSLYANAQARQTNESSLSSARNELSSLKAPTPPSGDDKDGSAKAAYESQKASYEAKKSELQSKISQLESEKTKLDNEYKQLEQEKANIGEAKTKAQAEIDKQQQIMDDAQKRMDDSLAKLSEKNPELKKSLENDEKLKTLQSQLEKIKSDISAKEEEISKIDSKISQMEMQDKAVAELRNDEAEAALNKAATEAGADVDGTYGKVQNNVAQEKYGKNYNDLSDDERKAIQLEVEGDVTTELMKWAHDKSAEDPNNANAKAVLEKGQDFLGVQQKQAFQQVSTALEGLPQDMRDGAASAIEDAIKKAEANGEDANLAAMNALSQYSGTQAASGALSAEDANAMKAIKGATDVYTNALENTNTGANLAGQEVNKKASVETTAIFDQVVSGAKSAQISDMIADMQSMVGLREGNYAESSKINQITGKSGINCSTTPWCAAFAMNMLKDHGVLDSSTCANINYCPTVKNWAQENGLWRNSKEYTPQAGDAILFDWQGDGVSRAQHIGVVTKVENGVVYTIEGNAGNAVSERQYNLNSGSILGYIDCGAQKDQA